jgi:hypothetical protein
MRSISLTWFIPSPILRGKQQKDGGMSRRINFIYVTCTLFRANPQIATGARQSGL